MSVVKQYYGTTSSPTHMDIGRGPNGGSSLNKERFEDSSFYTSTFFTTRNSLQTDTGDIKKANKLFGQTECKHNNKDGHADEQSILIYNQDPIGNNSSSNRLSQKHEVI
jgi:hypothetical protein